MIDRDCSTCTTFCNMPRENCEDWSPPELYTAYLEEKAQAERFRQALNCPRCEGTGIDCNNPPFSICNDCAEIRKEAKG